jgi:hypothetical protein
MIAFLAAVVILYAGVALALAGMWRTSAERDRAEQAARARLAEREEMWERHAHLGSFPVGVAELREAGWSTERAEAFLAEHFGGRSAVQLADLRPFLGDVTVVDVLRYRAARSAAAARYEPIRQTWINVDDLVKSGSLPRELSPFVCERERQSGKLIRATDMLPFVGRPIVRDLLERKLTNCGMA